MVYTIFSIFFILLLVYVVTRTVYGYFRRNRKERILYLREFKKGKCVAIYLIAIPLFFLGYIYVQGSGPYAVFESISKTFNSVINMVALRFEFMNVETLMKDNYLYGAAVIVCNILCILNAGVFIASLAQQYFWEEACHRRFNKNSGKKYILVGDNLGCRRIYNSITDGRKILVSAGSKKDISELYMENIDSFAINDELDFLITQIRSFAKKSDNENTKLFIVINTEDENKNLHITEKLREVIHDRFGDNPDLYMRLRIYVFASSMYEGLYHETETSIGCFRLVNKYKIVGMDFAEKYPHALGMRGYIDYETSLVDGGLNINTVFVGFGDINREIYRYLSITDQFISMDGGRIHSHPVNYHIFDINNAQDDVTLCQDHYRYLNEFCHYDEGSGLYVPKVDTEKYLPLPELPSRDFFHSININDKEFYRILRSIFTKDGNNFNRIVVAVGSDMENLNIAGRLKVKLNDWNISNTNIYVYSREKEDGVLQDNICYFGNEEKNIYNMAEIDDSMLIHFSLNRNRVYALESARKTGTRQSEEEVRRIADRKWFVEWPENKRDSNLYASLAVRSKLLMMGLDYEKKKANGKYLSYDEYMAIYAGDDLPTFDEGGSHGKGSGVRKIMDVRASRAYNMAYQEHLRWNAYMLSCGIVPADKETILCEKDEDGNFTNGNSYLKRHHGNLTDFDGLREFAKMIAERDGISAEKVDVICYDYQILDDAWWILDEIGYGIKRV